MSDGALLLLGQLSLIPLGVASIYRGPRPALVIGIAFAIIIAGEFAGLGFSLKNAGIIALTTAATAALCFPVRRGELRLEKRMSGIEADAARRRFRIGSMTRGMMVPNPAGPDDPPPDPNSYMPFTSYSTDRHNGSGVGDWTYLARPDKWAAPGRSWFKFHASTGEPPKELRDILDEIARVADGERLEFEGFRGEVTAYWQPPGEKVDSTKVFDWLEQLARF